jgi:hypothetical protein
MVLIHPRDKDPMMDLTGNNWRPGNLLIYSVRKATLMLRKIK